MLFVSPRRRPTRRFVSSFDLLQSRITPSSVTGTGALVTTCETTTTSGGVITDDMYDNLDWTVPKDYPATDTSTCEPIDPYLMTIPTTSC